jgi:ATP-dependent Clp protease ATP-binding subunit ClpC
LHARADAPTARALLCELGRIGGEIRGDTVQARKQEALSALDRPGFWDDPARFAVLAEAHYLDRLEQALRTAEKLGDRLRRVVERNGGGAVVAEMLALRLHVLGSALEGIEHDAPDDLFMSIGPASGEPAGEEDTERLIAMYLGWADRRGMQTQRLDSDGDDHLLVLGGLGAATILAPEAGLHVFERRGADGAATERSSIPVRLAGCPPGPISTRDSAAARRALDAVPMERRVVRRYRLDPDPLVRDSIRSFRTGRLDRVLAGDFDLF